MGQWSMATGRGDTRATRRTFTDRHRAGLGAGLPAPYTPDRPTYRTNTGYTRVPVTRPRTGPLPFPR